MTAERKDIEERYSHALESSHLRATGERVGDVDLLIAAGWCADSLGTTLYRLRLEFDSTRGDSQLAAANLRRARQLRNELMLEAQHIDKASAHVVGPTLAGRARRAAEAITREAEGALTTDLALVLMRLRTLPQARQALGRFAIGEATRRRFMFDDAAVCLIAGRALAFWLDPLCPHCNGRGFFGGVGSPRQHCHDCKGVGKKTARLGNEPSHHEFGRRLLVCMDSKTEYVSRRMRLWLRNRT